MSIIKSDLKKTFKIVLDSNQTSSFTGNQFDANFTVDLTKVLTDAEDYNRPYEMTFAFRSIKGTATTTGLDQSNVHLLCIDMNKGYNVYYYPQNRNVVGILPVNNDFTAYTATICPTFWDCKSSDNDSVLIRELNGITSIRLTVLESVTGTIFNPTNNGTVNTNTLYVCILTFTQL
jgi:hypothetical protein